MFPLRDLILDIGMDGASSLNEQTLSNYSILPKKIMDCLFITMIQLGDVAATLAEA